MGQFRYNSSTVASLLDSVASRLNRGYLEYGDEPINTLGVDGVAKMIQVKTDRILNLHKRYPHSPEKRDDSWLDVLGYGTLGWMADAQITPTEGGGVECPAPTRMLLPPQRRLQSVYLSGPIADVSEQSRNMWIRKAAKMLADHRIVAYSPYHALPYGRMARSVSTDPVIMAIDRSAILACDGLLANFWEDSTSIGSPREVEFALSKGKPVVAVAPGRSTVWLCDAIRTDSLEDAVEFLAKLQV